MLNLTKYISELLSEHDCVIIPEIGAFIANYKHAYLEGSHLNPPSKTVAFNSSLKSNDGLLIHHIAQKEGITYQQATEEVDIAVKTLLNVLKTENKVVFNKVGELRLNESSSLEFNPFNSFNFLSDAYGLFPLSVQKIVRHTYLPQGSATVKKEKKSQPQSAKAARKVLYYSLSVYLPVFALLWAFLLIKEPFSGQVAGISVYENNSANDKIIEIKDVPVPDRIEEIVNPENNKTDEEANNQVVNENVASEIYYVIGGCFQDAGNAEKFKSQLLSESYSNAGIISDSRFNRVYYEQFSDKELAQNFLINLQKNGNLTAWILKQ